MLGLRLAFGVPLFFIMIGVIWADVRYGSGWGLAIMQALFCAWAVREFYRLARVQGAKPFVLPGMIGCALLYLVQEYSAINPPAPGLPGYDLLLFGLICVFVLLIQLFRHGNSGALMNISSTIGALVIFWLLLSFMGRMRHLELRHGWEYDGMEFVFVYFCGSKICDIAGLLVGRRYGYHKLWPAISPKKSWEGFIGGMAASVGLLAVVMTLHPQSALAAAGWVRVLPLGIVLAVLGLLGDLVESAFKREGQLKDAGSSLPGFGGVMDMVDSLVLNAPVMYLYLIYVCGARPAA